MVDFIPLDSRRKHEEIADQIRELSISRRLEPGSRLPTERLLAKRLNVSRTAIRDAFLLLESQGFLVVKRGRNGGAYLQKMHPRQLVGSFSDMLRLGQVSIEQLLDARLGIETSLLDFIPTRGPGRSIDKLDANLAEAWRLSRTRGAADKVELLRNLHEFHHLLAGATKNPVFILAVGTVMSILQKFLEDVGHHTCVSLDSVTEHQAVLDGIKENRIEAARHALREHLLNDNRRTVALIRRRRRTSQAVPSPAGATTTAGRDRKRAFSVRDRVNRAPRTIQSS